MKIISENLRKTFSAVISAKLHPMMHSDQDVDAEDKFDDD